MSRKRILLIEDDASLVVTLRYLLDDLGYDPVVAVDHAQARAVMDQGPFDLAIIDYFLDNVPASDLIAELRARHPRMPLVCSTAAFAEQLELDHPATKPDAILYKPFGVDDLRQTLQTLTATDRVSSTRHPA